MIKIQAVSGGGKLPRKQSFPHWRQDFPDRGKFSTCLPKSSGKGALGGFAEKALSFPAVPTKDVPRHFISAGEYGILLPETFGREHYERREQLEFQALYRTV